MSCNMTFTFTFMSLFDLCVERTVSSLLHDSLHAIAVNLLLCITSIIHDSANNWRSVVPPVQITIMNNKDLRAVTR